MSRDLDMMTSSSLISSSKLVLDESVSRQVERTVMEYLEAPINPPVDRAGLAQMMKGEMFMHGAVDTPRHKQCTSVIGKFLLVEEKALENFAEVEELRAKVIEKLKALGGSANKELVAIVKKYEPSTNPNKMKDVEALKNLLNDVENFENEVNSSENQ